MKNQLQGIKNQNLDIKQYETNLIRILEMPSNFTNLQSVYNLVLFIHHNQFII